VVVCAPQRATVALQYQLRQTFCGSACGASAAPEAEHVDRGAAFISETQ
jgi:hypothetical protein